MKFMKISVRCLLVLLALCLAATTLLGCETDIPSADEQDGSQEEKMPPRIENNVVAQIPFTAMWYRPDMFGDLGVELTDPYVCQSVLAVFNNVEFRGLNSSESMEDVYLEMKESQYVLLEGGATIFVCDNGRVMLTILNAGQYFTDVGAVDVEALRQICAPLLEAAAAQQ